MIIAAMAAIVIALMQLTGVPKANEQSSHDSGATNASTRENGQTREQRLIEMANGWGGEIVYGSPYSALTPLSSVENAATDSRFDPTDDYWGLPRSEGVETVAGYCSACHSLAIVMQQRQNREGWNDLLSWMIEKQGMAPPPDETREEILDYLTREFGA